MDKNVLYVIGAAVVFFLFCVIIAKFAMPELIKQYPALENINKTVLGFGSVTNVVH